MSHNTSLQADLHTLTTIQKNLTTHTSPLTPADEASLTKAKLLLLKHNALLPTPTTPPRLLYLAKTIFEAAALHAIRAREPAEFVRYVDMLRGFWELGDSLDGSSVERGGESGMGSRGKKVVKERGENRRKIMGLFLLVLLTKGDYAAFHTELEGLETRREWDVEGGEEVASVEEDRYLGYPVKIERWLMEGSYDQVWKAMGSGEVPSEEYAVFYNILTPRIRLEIASCSERAYPSLPISSTKSLLFLESEGAVIKFAQSRHWIVRDGRIYFPSVQAASAGGEAGVGESGEGSGNSNGGVGGSGSGSGEKALSQMAIENTLGYARELETIV